VARKLIVTCCVALAALAFAPTALAEVGDSASGSGTVPSGHVFSFSATGGPDDTATGTMTFAIAATGFTGTLSVRCLIVEGNEAAIVGTYVTASDPRKVGEEEVFVVEDNATPGAGSDRWTVWGVHAPGASCPTYSDFLGFTAGQVITVGEITVVQASAEQKVATLIAELQSTPTGPGDSYVAKLQSIADSLAAGNTEAACNKLDAFAKEVQAQAGKKLTQGEAAELLAATAAIKTRAGCP
jgi:hypothetical protein